MLDLEHKIRGIIGKGTYALVASAAALSLIYCGGSSTSPTRIPPNSPPSLGIPAPVPEPIPTPEISQIFSGAGDIAICGSPAPEATAKLLDITPGTIFADGDLAYDRGTEREFRDCYEPTWGRHKARTRPAPGNHDYLTNNAQPYFDYFGANAGPPGLGYYSFDLGKYWHAVSLNSNIERAASNAQAVWFRADMAANRSNCRIAYWHHPLFSSGLNGNNSHVKYLWQIFEEFNGDVIITGHDHDYERFALQDSEGRPNPKGAREFVVGTGGMYLNDFQRIVSNSEVRIPSVHGILKLELNRNSYSWQFISTGGAVLDSGTGECHVQQQNLLASLEGRIVFPNLLLPNLLQTPQEIIHGIYRNYEKGVERKKEKSPVF